MSEIDSNVPQYKLEENDQEIIISIAAPLSKPKEAALLLEKDVFTFDSPPYLLKLRLPHSISENFSQPAYNTETRSYLVRLKKTFKYQDEPGEEKDGKILEPQENINGESPAFISKTGDKQCYGFANKYSNMFGKLYDEFLEVINLPDPDNTNVKERSKLRIKEENEKWSDDHYLADTMETHHLESIFQFKPPWATSHVKDEYTNDERQMLNELINNPKLNDLTIEERKLCEYHLVDILFCYAYNRRTTEGDDSVESGWTINKLSSTLSWLEVFENLKMVLLACYRRALIFPLYRNWNLARLIHQDVAQILKLGPVQVTKSLLEVREIFNENDNCYILNTLYVNDLCGFAYHMSKERCIELAAEIDKINVTKYEVNNDLPLLEIAAHLTLEEETNPSQRPESDVSNIIQKIGVMNISDSSTDSSESESEDSESSQLSVNKPP